MPNPVIPWPADADATIRDMWGKASAHAICRQIGIYPRRVLARARELGLPVIKFRDITAPPSEEWIAVASEKAREAGVRPGDVLGGTINPKVTRARWEAWRDILAANPHYSLAGVGRTSGYDHTTVRSGLLRLAGGAPKR